MTTENSVPFLLKQIAGSTAIWHDFYYKYVCRGGAWVVPVVLLNGRAKGVWSHRRQGKQLVVTVEPSALRRAHAGQAQRLYHDSRAFTGAPDGLCYWFGERQTGEGAGAGGGADDA